MPRAPETKPTELADMLARLEDQMRRMHDDLDSRLDAIAESLEARGADEEAEALAAERHPKRRRRTYAGRRRSAHGTRHPHALSPMSEKADLGVPVTFADGVRDDVASLIASADAEAAAHPSWPQTSSGASPSCWSNARPTPTLAS